jgi:hypothetical protein
VDLSPRAPARGAIELSSTPDVFRKMGDVTLWALFLTILDNWPRWAALRKNSSISTEVKE